MCDVATVDRTPSRRAPPAPVPAAAAGPVDEIAVAVAAIHDRPGHPWTVAALADAVVMSRTVFAERFAAAVGQTPARYLAAVRMRHAAELLRSSAAGVREVATRVGYESEAAFGHAFKRAFGVAPGTYRRQGPAAEKPPPGRSRTPTES